MFKPKAFVKLVSGLPLRDPEALLELTFDDEFLIITEKHYAGFKWIVDNVFKIPHINMIASSTEIDFAHYYVEQGTERTVFYEGIVRPYAVTKTSKDVKKKTALSREYNISYINSIGEVGFIKFSTTFMMFDVAHKFNKKLVKKQRTIPKSREVLMFYQQMQDPKHKETIL
ncbi:hypothetical protein DFP94_101172 [Fontibacillus phaseoli]|uniref:Uncharacterized protein n=1 Tax=Fontibacillus phaseoli TaxID=1416533 RepID=A0A369BLW6_9BACL|nr:hypothetical protein [Fontibacillus phaseoli]RCX22592.1 hypothetical protein DFP94_101172 [Fontibacillus phaseoli]